MRAGTFIKAQVGPKPLDIRFLPSPRATRLRVRVGSDGVSLVVPGGCDEHRARAFLQEHEAWIWDQIARLSRLRAARRDLACEQGTVLFRGKRWPVRTIERPNYRGSSQVQIVEGRIEVVRGPSSSGSVDRALERWMRREAKRRILAAIAALPSTAKRPHGRIYVMAQRTKWGNCSVRGNLSFNWRLIMAPDYVLDYIVAHEVAHLAVPDHSPKFWLLVQSFHPASERARQWLCRHGADLYRVPLLVPSTETDGIA